MSNTNDRSKKKAKKKAAPKEMRVREKNRKMIRVLRKMILIDGLDITNLAKDLQSTKQDSPNVLAD